MLRTDYSERVGCSLTSLDETRAQTQIRGSSAGVVSAPVMPSLSRLRRMPAAYTFTASRLVVGSTLFTRQGGLVIGLAFALVVIGSGSPCVTFPRNLSPELSHASAFTTPRGAADLSCKFDERFRQTARNCSGVLDRNHQSRFPRRSSAIRDIRRGTLNTAIPGLFIHSPPAGDRRHVREIGIIHHRGAREIRRTATDTGASEQKKQSLW